MVLASPSNIGKNIIVFLGRLCESPYKLNVVLTSDVGIWGRTLMMQK